MEKQLLNNLSNNLDHLQLQAAQLETDIRKSNRADRFFDAEQYEGELELVRKKIELIKNK